MIYSTTEETNISLSYNTRLRPATYESESEANTIDIQNKTYTYNEDGTIKQAADNVESKYGQLYEYDFASRLKKNQFGTGSASPTPQYKQILGYDAFSNLTGRQTWDKDNNERTFTAGYTNNRKTTGGYGIGTDTHDNAGNVVRNIVTYAPVDERNWKFDAAGRMADWEETSTYLGTTRWDQGATLTFDGDGRSAKRVKRQRIWASPPTGWSNEAEYTIFSSVTGQPIIELDNTGQKKKANVHLGSSVIAEQVGAFSPFTFKNTDPITGGTMATEADGDFPPNDSGRTEMEPLGSVIPTQEPETDEPPHDYSKGASTSRPEACQLNGAPANCQQQKLLLRSWGYYFAGDYLVVATTKDTWRKKARVMPTKENPGFRILETWTELVSSEIIATERISIPASNPGEKWSEFFNFIPQGAAVTVDFKGNAAARDALEKLTKLGENPGECGQKLNELLKNLKGYPNMSNTTRSNDILKVFDSLNSQKVGGIRLNSNDAAFTADTGVNPGAGGGGGTVSKRPGQDDANMYVHVYSWHYPTFAASPRQRVTPALLTKRRIETIQTNMLRLVHEITHGAGRNVTFSERQIEAAAIATDPSLKDSSSPYNDFVKKHCTNYITKD